MNLYKKAYETLSLLAGMEAPAPRDPHIRETTPSPRRQIDGEAVGLLLELGYLRMAEGGGTLGIDECDKARLKNRLALLKLASRLERVFSLPLPYSRGVAFFGAVVLPESFGASEHKSSGVAGRGKTLQQAFESCMGEAAEYLSFIEGPGDPLLCENPTRNQGLDKNESWMCGGLGEIGLGTLAKRDWVKAYSLSNGKDYIVPSELVLRRPEATRTSRRETESTGVAAGPTFEDATLSAALEVIERDAIALWWYGGKRAGSVTTIDLDRLGLSQFVQDLKRSSGRRIHLYDITTDLGVPVFAAVSADLDGNSVVLGFSARLSRRDAIKSALLELCQMELAHEISLDRSKELGHAALTATDLLWVGRKEKLRLADLAKLVTGISASPVGERVEKHSLSVLVAHLEAAGYPSYTVDLTRPEINIPVARVIIPELQSSRPDWVSARLRTMVKNNDRSLRDIGSIPIII